MLKRLIEVALPLKEVSEQSAREKSIRHGHISTGEGSLALHPNKWIKAQRFGKDYWLYVVVNCKTNPQLYLIEDPASKLNPMEEVSVVRYMLGQSDWRNAAGGQV